MAKYKNIPVIVDAEVYHKGLEDGWELQFSGEHYDYKHSFEDIGEANYFVNNNLGQLEIRPDDKYSKIIYEEPIPFIKTLRGREYMNLTDYIITDAKNRKHSCDASTFKMTYERIIIK